jgi:hypothetical protein
MRYAVRLAGFGGGSAFFTIEHVTHCTPASCALFLARALVAEVATGFFIRFRFAALGAAIGKAGLAGPQFELFTANDTGFDWESHTQIW